MSRCPTRVHAKKFQYTSKIRFFRLRRFIMLYFSIPYMTLHRNFSIPLNSFFSPAALYYVIIFQYTLQKFQYTPRNLRTKIQYTHRIYDKKNSTPRIIGRNFSIPSNLKFRIIDKKFSIIPSNHRILFSLKGILKSLSSRVH